MEPIFTYMAFVFKNLILKNFFPQILSVIMNITQILLEKLQRADAHDSASSEAEVVEVGQPTPLPGDEATMTVMTTTMGFSPPVPPYGSGSRDGPPIHAPSLLLGLWMGAILSFLFGKGKYKQVQMTAIEVSKASNIAKDNSAYDCRMGLK